MCVRGRVGGYVRALELVVERITILRTNIRMCEVATI